jgi:hypothetical protein
MYYFLNKKVLSFLISIYVKETSDEEISITLLQ